MERALLEAWRERARVRVATWVHPDCDPMLHDSFAGLIAHALKSPLRRDGLLLLSDDSVPFFFGPWSELLAHIDVLAIPQADVLALLAASDGGAFAVCPDAVNELWRAQGMDATLSVTHVMGVVPRAWLHARVEMAVRSRLSVTDMVARSALLDEMRFLHLDPPRQTYASIVSARLPPPARNERRAGLYQRYVVSHEFGHLMGLGHPREGWRDAAREIVARIARQRRLQHGDATARFQPCMDQQTVNAYDDARPLPVPSTLDILLQTPRGIGTALAQVDALFPPARRRPTAKR